MSTPFYDLASLVVVPSGYKASKVYAQKPLTTDGQLAFTRSTTATRVNSAGLIESVAINVPRLDYTNSTCPKLLLEPSRTNLLSHSSDFASNWTSYYAGTGSAPAITSNNATAPDGTMTADTVVFNSGAGTTAGDSSMLGTALFVAAGDYSMSFYARVTSGTAKIVSRHATGGSYTSINITTTWQRFAWTENAASATTIYPEMGIRRGLANEPLNSTATVQLWGIQLEAGAYPTSLIPTTTAAVTRGADAASKTGISSLIGQTEGTIFGEMYTNPSGTESLLTWLRNGTAGLYGNFIFLGTNSSAQSRVQVVQGGIQQVEILGSALAVGWHKFALAYKLNDFAFYVDGVQIGTASSGTIPTGMNELFIDQYIDGGIRNASKNQALLFKTRLTNAQLAELTTI